MDYFSTDHFRSGLRKRATRGAGVTVLSQVLIYGIQTVGTIVLARLLTPDDFGLVTMVLAFSMLLQNFGFNGFTEVVIQREAIYHKQISTLFWINVLMNVGLTLLFMLLSPLIAGFYGEPRLKSIVIAIAISITFTGLSTEHLALLKRTMEFNKAAAIEVVATIGGVSTSITLAYSGWGYWALVARWVVQPLITTLGAWTLCTWRPGLPASHTGVKSMLGFAFNTYGNFVTDYFRRNMDKVLLGRFYGTQPLGYYDRAYHLANMLPNQLIHPLTSVAIATLSRLSHDRNKYRHHYLEILSVLAFIGMPLSAVLTLAGQDLVLLLLGPQWKKAGEIFCVLGPSIGVLLLYLTHGWLHLSLGTPDRWFRWGIVAFVVTGICFFAGLPFGAFGVAAAYSSSFCILIAPGLWYAGRPINLKLSSVLSITWRYGVCALTSGLFCWFILYSIDSIRLIFLELHVFVRIVVSLGFCLSLYLVLILAFFQGVEPLRHFIFIMRDMLPGFSRNKERTL